jgi:hypothetical protein
MRNGPPIVVLLAAAAFAPTACRRSEPIVPSVSVDAGLSFGADGAPDEGAAWAAPPGGATAWVCLAPPEGSPLDAALDVGVSAQAAKDAPGMSVEGQIRHATLAEGETFPVAFVLQPGRCYTIIAMSSPRQVSQLELRLLAAPSFEAEVGRSAASDTNPAILGRGRSPTCATAPLPMPHRVDVIARKGAGRVGIAVFATAP